MQERGIDVSRLIFIMLAEHKNASDMKRSNKDIVCLT